MELSTIMASLELSEACSSCPSDAGEHQVWEDCATETKELEDSFVSEERRSRRLRRKSALGVSGGGISKGRCSIQPVRSKQKGIAQPLRSSKLQTEKDIEDYYLNKKFKVKSTSLETIYEEPRPVKNQDPVTMGGVKQKRAITFDSNVTKAKLKRRKVKVKKMLSGRRDTGKCKFSIQDVKLRLAESELYHLSSNSP